MEDSYEYEHQLRALAMRVAALEDNVAFLEEWCEEQQDTLDRAAGPIGYDYEIESEPEPVLRTLLRVVDLREGAEGDDRDSDADAIFAVVETEHDRRVRLIRTQLNRIRTRLAMSVAPPAPAEQARVKPRESREPREPRRAPGAGTAKVSARPAGRTAP